MEKKEFVVPNISCGHCVKTIQNEVGEIAGVKLVQAEEKSKKVVVEWDAPATWAQIVQVLTEADYPPEGVSNVRIN